ncbi:MAG: CRISPR-associated helicase Cas3' [Eubacteriales bacterium]|nr:CRISPR-associated helicase Cas3' [Eubacteriales bacterium]
MEFIAHSGTERTPDGHGLAAHLRDVAHKAQNFFANPFLRNAAYLIGLHHDAGKYKSAVQHHIRYQSAERIDHATLGAQLIAEKCAVAVYPLLAAAMLGHHGGMPDYTGKDGTGGRPAEARLRADDDVQAETARRAFGTQMAAEKCAPLAGIPPVSSAETLAMEAYLAARMLHSALVDADYLDTEAYFQPEQAALRGTAPALHTLLPLYQAHMQKLQAASTAAISDSRSKIWRQCMAAADGLQGIYTLSVPTGGGKTLSSMGFALRHAQAHPHIRRVIYAIPFTSITEQNAGVFRDIFGEQAVLEHHSAMAVPEEGRRADHASENWDAPIVVTTNVQLFETIFGNTPSRSRKLHNIQNAVIVLDEMQALPDGVLKPCLAALDALARHYGVTVIVCTATQPKYDGIWPSKTQVKEIIDDPLRLQRRLRRTYVQQLGALDDDALLQRLREHRHVLCIVNSRAAARALAEELGQSEQGVYHLSTMMCPKHRRAKLDEIRARLKDESRPCRVISTSLIEAGVDVDFPAVYREAAGLDSIAQAAGRCNRAGDRPLSAVYVFTLPARRLPDTVQRLANQTMTEIAPRYAEDMLSIPAMAAYFALRFGPGSDTDATGVLRMIRERGQTLKFPYASIAAEFRIIQSASQPVFIPFDDEARGLIGRLRAYGISAGLLRALQPYAASVYPNQVHELTAAGRIENIDGALVLAAGDADLADVYSADYGLLAQPQAQGYFE